MEDEKEAKSHFYSGQPLTLAISPSKGSESLFIRRVINGWIVTDMDPADRGAVSDTLVFNNIDDLCEGIKMYYGEKINETK